MGPGGQAQLQRGRLSTTANQPALRLLSPLVPHPHGPNSHGTHCAIKRIPATRLQDVAQNCIQHRSRTPLALGAAPELCKQGNRDYRRMVTIFSLWTTQGLAVGGPGTWTAARSAEKPAATHCPWFWALNTRNTSAPALVLCLQVQPLWVNSPNLGTAPCSFHTTSPSGQLQACASDKPGPNIIILYVLALWTTQGLAVVGPGSWTAARSAEICAA